MQGLTCLSYEKKAFHCLFYTCVMQKKQDALCSDDNFNLNIKIPSFRLSLERVLVNCRSVVTERLTNDKGDGTKGGMDRSESCDTHVAVFWSAVQILMSAFTRHSCVLMIVTECASDLPSFVCRVVRGERESCVFVCWFFALLPTKGQSSTGQEQVATKVTQDLSF